MSTAAVRTYLLLHQHKKIKNRTRRHYLAVYLTQALAEFCKLIGQHARQPFTQAFQQGVKRGTESVLV